MLGVGEQKVCWRFQKFVDGQQCFAFTPQANFPAHNLNFYWRTKVKVMGSNPGYLLKSFLLYRRWFDRSGFASILPKNGGAITPSAPSESPALFLMINRILAKTDCIISHFHIPGHLGLCSILYMISRIFVCRYFSYLLANRLEKVK